MAWRLCRFLVLAVLSLCVARAEPFIFYRGILNAASFAPSGIPNGSIARGSIFSIFGRDLGPAQGMTVSSFPLGTTFQGVSIEVCQNGACVQALPLFVLSSQINAIMPSNAPLGTVSIRVTFNGTAGNFSPATVVASSFGTFAINSGGFGPGVVQNFTPAALPINSSAAAARPGQTVVLWGTGLGAGLNADNVAPQAGDLPVPVEIWAGGKPVTVKRYSGRTPCCAGVDQIVFDLPADTPTGCYVPVAIRAGGVVSNDTTVSIGAAGQPCSSTPGSLDELLRQGGTLGRINLIHASTAGPSADARAIEVAAAFFGQESGGPFAYHPLYAEIPEGACIVQPQRGALSETRRIAASVGESDAGPEFVVSTARGERLLRSRPAGLGGYFDVLGRFNPLPPQEQSTAIFDPGAGVRIVGAGGAGLGPMDVGLVIPDAPNWTNAAGLATVIREQDLTLTWTPVNEPDAIIWIVGLSTATTHDAAVRFTCRATANRGLFVVPSPVLSRLPPSDSLPFPSTSLLGIALQRASSVVSLAATGLNRGIASAASMTILPAEYR